MALIMVAQVASAGGGGVTSVRVGEFLSMGACRSAAEHSVSDRSRCRDPRQLRMRAALAGVRRRQSPLTGAPLLFSRWGKSATADIALAPLREEDDQIVLADAIEGGACLLLEQVAIDRRAAHQVDPMPPFRALGLGRVELGRQHGDRLLVFAAHLQAAVAVDRVPDEIAADAPGDEVEHQREEDRAKARADDHGR